MNLRRAIFLRTVGLLTALIATICLAMALFIVREHRQNAKEDALLTSQFLASKGEDLVLWDDRVALKDLLDKLIATHDGVEYACIDRNAKPYVRAYKNSQIEIPSLSGAISTGGPRVDEFRTRQGETIWDVVAPIGSTGAVVRIGFLQSRIDRESLVQVCGIAATGGMAMLFGMMLAALVARRTTREVDKAVAELRQYQDHLEHLVAERTRELAESNEALERDIEHRKRVESDLAEAKAMAESANRAKSEFLANMSHEIRTPMTAILGFTDILRENLTDPEDIDAVETVRRNGEHLLEVINDILDLSRVEAGKLSFEIIDCSPVDVLAEVVSLMRVRAVAKGLQLEVQNSGPIPQTIQCDPTRLRQILLNLVGNAIKFTGSGTVRVLMHLAENANPPLLQFDVVDTGIGIGEEQIRSLFRPFTQADSSTSRKYGGTGLGLVISKRFANLLGGDISVQSTLGQGSIFTLTVATGPLSRTTLCEPTQEAAAPRNGIEAKSNPTRCLLHSRVLLADDCVDNQRLIEVILGKAGAQVTIAENGAIACEYALGTGFTGGNPDLEHSEPFDLILMDMQMPVMDGYEATKTLRSRGYAGPIIALTAHVMNSDREKCINAGCDDYISKPVYRDALLEVVARYARSEATSR